MWKRDTVPDQFMKHKLALRVHKLYNIIDYKYYNPKECVLLNLNQILTSRQEFFICGKNNRIKIGINCLANRLNPLNKTLPLGWLNDSLCSFKIKCKKLMLL